MTGVQTCALPICLSLKILSGSCLHFVAIRVFIVRYEKECEKSFFSKIGCIGKSLVIGQVASSNR